MAEDHQRRLTSTEASFLYREKPHEPMHIGGCGVYQGHISRHTVLHLLADRLHQLPRYRQKVIFPPLGLAHPSWVDDPDFDLSHHVEEVTLPDPGDDNALSICGGKIFSTSLDRHHPLWKLILLHGRADGNTAIIAKVHYAMVEGVSGTALTSVLHDLQPDVPATSSRSPRSARPKASKPAPLPDFLTQLQDALRDTVTSTARWWTDESFRLLRSLREGPTPAQRLSTASQALASLLQPAPCVPFNGRLSSARQFAWAEFAFPEIRAIRSTLGGTVNDVVLAIISGGLGQYLRAKNYDPQSMELRVACPVVLRRHGTGHTRDEDVACLSTMIAPLYPGIADPVLRLAAEREAMDELKAHQQAKALAGLHSVSHLFPPAWQALTTRLPFPNTLTNTVSLNVPGPQIPLYLAGHKRLALYSLGPLTANIGLFHATTSYNQKITISVTVDPQLVPKVWQYIECLRASFTELRDAAEQVRQQPTSPDKGQEAEEKSQHVSGEKKTIPTKP